MKSFEDANPFQRAARRFGVISWARYLSGDRFLPTLDRWTARATGNRHTLSSLALGIPAIQLVTVGRKSGEKRTVVLLGFPIDDQSLFVIASSYGRAKHPGRYLNLASNPAAKVLWRHGEWTVRARPTEPEERDRLYAEACRAYPGYRDYEKRAAPRRIPVMVLERTG